jgi:hypothetical protein
MYFFTYVGGAVGKYIHMVKKYNIMVISRLNFGQRDDIIEAFVFYCIQKNTLDG